MPEPRLLDLYDELDGAVDALAGIRDLVVDASAPGKQFSIVRPAELGELLDMVERRLRRAVDQLDA